MLEQIPSMSTEELWNEYRRLYALNEVEKKDFDKVKYGINLKVDIRLYLMYEAGDERIIQLLAKVGRVRIGTYEVSLQVFQDEFEAREDIMRLKLVDYYEDTGITKPR